MSRTYFWSKPKSSAPIKSTPFAVKVFFDGELRVYDARKGIWMSYEEWIEKIEELKKTLNERELKFLNVFLERYPNELNVRIYFFETMRDSWNPYYASWARRILPKLYRRRETLGKET